ncbi:MAG: hypothetical protein WBJ37_03660 [Bacteroidales bacterium]
MFEIIKVINLCSGDPVHSFKWLYGMKDLYRRMHIGMSGIVKLL